MGGGGDMKKEKKTTNHFYVRGENMIFYTRHGGKNTTAVPKGKKLEVIFCPCLLKLLEPEGCKGKKIEPVL